MELHMEFSIVNTQYTSYLEIKVRKALKKNKQTNKAKCYKKHPPTRLPQFKINNDYSRELKF